MMQIFVRKRSILKVYFAHVSVNSAEEPKR